MTSVSQNNFGLLIAYLVPGFTALWGASYFSGTLRSWLGASQANSPTLGGFLYVTVGSLTAGLLVSTIRWAIIDSLHHWTGIRKPEWDFSRLQANVTAFDVLIEIHYKFYQFYAGMLLAVAFLYVSRRLALGFWSLPLGWTEVGFLLLEWTFWAGSRDTLRKYYSRVEKLLGNETATIETPPKPPKETAQSCPVTRTNQQNGTP